MGCLIGVTIAVIKHRDQNQPEEKRVCLHFPIFVHLQRKSGKKLKQERNLGAEADAEEMEE